MPQADPQKQREFAVEIVRRLRERGHEALWAGGCVRDRLLGRTPKDYDVATTARPEEVRELFGMHRTVAVGAAFGVIAVIGPKPAGQIEVVTFRQDMGYSDNRRPDAVEFSTPEADAQRRDFTINGLFYDPIGESVIDFVGGQEDLARGIVRAIGDPRARFGEDKLRLLRAARFAATYGFELEGATRQAVVEMAGDVTLVSAERIAAEMRMMLVHPARAAAVKLLGEVGLLAAVVPEVSQAGEAWTQTLGVMESLENPTFALALAALLHAPASPAKVEEVCRRWKLSNHDTRRAVWLLQNQHALLDARRMPWSRLQRMLTSPGIGELLDLHEAIARSTSGDTQHLEYCRTQLKRPGDELDPPPLITGDDLIAQGVPRGKQYQTLLEAVRDAQLEKKIATRQQALELVARLVQSAPGGQGPSGD